MFILWTPFSCFPTNPLDLTIPNPSFHRIPKLTIIFGQGSLHVLLLATGKCLSDGNWAEYCFMTMSEYCYESFHCFLGLLYFVLPQFSRPASSGLEVLSWMVFLSRLEFRLEQSLVGPCRNSEAPLPRMHCQKDKCGPKTLWLTWCPSPITGSLMWLEKIAGSASVILITRSPH